MPDQTQTSEPPRRKSELDVLTKWSAVILIIVGLLTAGYSLIHYAARLKETQIHLSSTLPANYRDTLKALLVSAGESCPKVCALTATHAEPDRTTFRVTCGIAHTGEACASTAQYALTLTPEP